MKSRFEKVLWIVLALVLLGMLTTKVSSRRSDLPAKRSTNQLVHTSQLRLAQNYGKLPLSFELNKGQTDSQVKFLSRGSGYTLFLTGNEAVLSLRKPSAASRQLSASRWLPVASSLWWPATNNGPRTTDVLFPALIQNPKSQIPNPPAPSPEPLAPDVVRVKLVGANPKAKVVGLDPLPGKSNYFLGNDPKKWRTNVSNYAKVKYKDVYPGIDLVYYGNQGRLEHDFVVAPGADPRVIALNIDGAEKMQIDPQGDLVLSNDGGDVRLHKPVVYQVQSTVDSRQSKATDNEPRTKDAANSPFTIHHSQFVEGRFLLLASNRIGFEVSNYDKTKPLIIDPVLSYSTYLGGSGSDGAYGIAVDASGNAYVTGLTYSNDFLTRNPIQATCGGCTPPPYIYFDAFVAKIDTTKTGLASLIYSTYLGGSNYDYGVGIAVDSSGNAYVTGATYSADFPTVNPLQENPNGAFDAFVAKIAENRPPMANAGADRVAECTGHGCAQITLDGSGSSDPDGDPLTYKWTGPFPQGGGTVTGVNPTLTLPLGTSTITLVVNDGKVDSTPARVKITVTLQVAGLQPPLAALVPESSLPILPGNAFKLGRTLPVKLQLLCQGTPQTSGDVLPPHIAGLVRGGNALDLSTLDLDAGEANDSGVQFRYADGNWIYNLSTAGLSSGTYTLTIQTPDGQRYNAGFVLR